ncbi:hypothetical protein EMIT0158MI4_30401 [Burkholderia ambifaria]
MRAAQVGTREQQALGNQPVNGGLKFGICDVAFYLCSQTVKRTGRVARGKLSDGCSSQYHVRAGGARRIGHRFRPSPASTEDETELPWKLRGFGLIEAPVERLLGQPRPYAVVSFPDGGKCALDIRTKAVGDDRDRSLGVKVNGASGSHLSIQQRMSTQHPSGS